MFARFTRSTVSLLPVLGSLAFPAGAAGPPVLDACDSAAGWVVAPSDGVQARLTTVPRGDGRALRLEYDFTTGAGFVVVRRPVELELGANYRFSLDVRGSGPPNNLEFKLIDASGDSVWWVNRRRFVPPEGWQTLVQKKRHFEFAWGPSGGAPLEAVSALELAVASAEGGRGFIEFDNLTYEDLPEPQPLKYPLRVRTSSSAAGEPLSFDLAEDGALRWRSAADDASPALIVDFGRSVELGGLKLVWGTHDYPSRYELAASHDGRTWMPLASIDGANGGRDYVYLPQAEAAALRITIADTSQGRGVALGQLHVLPPRFGDSANEAFTTIARDSPRGRLPRYFLGEQQPWTVVGVDGDAHEALIDAGGAVELGKLGWRLEPFLHEGDTLVTWADVETTHRLHDDRLPIPTVTWRRDGLRLEITAVAFGDAGNSSLALRYALTNERPAARRARLYLAARPFQVLPPWQTLNITGGVAPIHRLTWDGAVLRGGEHSAQPLSPPERCGAATFAAGEIVEHLAAGTFPDAHTVDDPLGWASGAFEFVCDLPPNGTRSAIVLVPLSGEGARFPWSPAEPVANARESVPNSRAATENARESGLNAAFSALLERVAADWRAKIERVGVRVPPAAKPLADTFYATQAYILINADGPGIQPGSRTYERSWIRDGALTCTALLQNGHAERVRAFIDWYAPYQFDNGKVPCVVDRRGPDPVPEHDSTGQLIYLLRTYYRYTGDREVLARHLPRVVAGVDYLDALRQQRLTPAYCEGPPEKRVLCGLVPESISHEGYSAKPMHSYWDGFFVVRGYKDAAEIAGVLGKADLAARCEDLLAAYRDAMYESMRRSMNLHDVDYVPGCAELGDFDATSTAIGVCPCGELGRIPEPALRNTFDRFWDFFQDRRAGRIEWSAYTPYELRMAGVYVHLGQRERAHALCDYYFQHQYPAGWQHWAEVVYRDPATPGFVGDMPHTWCGSEFLRSFRTLFVYEREADGALVVAAGVPGAWLDGGEPVEITDWRTEYGALSYRLWRADGKFTIELELDGDAPPGGIVVQPPLAGTIRAASVDSVPVETHGEREIAVARPRFRAEIHE